MPGSTQIYINGKFLAQKATGVQKYAIGIALALQKSHPDVIILTPRGKHETCGLKIKKIGLLGGTLWEQICLPLFLIFKKHSLLLNFCNSAPLLIKSQVITLHDLAFRKNKYWFGRAFRLWYNFLIPKICRNSQKIITVSELIKKEICTAYSITSEKIIIVPNGIPEMHFDEVKPFAFNYLFLTGIYNPRKNATFLLSLLSEIKNRNLHVVGVGENADIYKNIAIPEDDHLHLLKYVSNKQYYTFLKHATALVFPSEYEGFGIPVLEALSLGTPVIVPDVSLYQESFGEMPIYYLPGYEQSFLQALDQINYQSPSKNELTILKNKFNFDNSATILSDTLKQLLQKNIN